MAGAYQAALDVFFNLLTYTLTPNPASSSAGIPSPPNPLSQYGRGGEGGEGIACGNLHSSAQRMAIEAARSTVQSCASPHRALSAVYEDLLQYSPVESRGEIELVRSDADRKAHGAFYTPEAVVRSVVEAALTPLLERGISRPAVLDPAMGTGCFLLEAVRFLAAQGAGEPAEIAESCLFGIDRDPMAIRLAIVAISLETGARPDVLAQRLCQGDALCDELPAASFDAVLGNPPWGARWLSPDRERLARRFPASSRLSFDSFKLFLDLGSACSRGTLGMVVPQAVLAQSTHADVRQVLMERMAPHAAARLDDRAFLGAAAPACTLVFGPRPGPPSIRVGRWDTVPADHWKSSGEFSLARHDLVSFLHRLRAAHPCLGHLEHLYRVRDVGLNYNRASVAARVLYDAHSPEDPRDLPRYRGRNFARYTGISRGGWLRHDARSLLEPGETISLGWETCALPEKLVFRQTADRIVATLDRSRMVLGRSVIAVTARADVSLRALLACLNSRLMTVLYRTLAGEEGRVLPQVKVARMAALPLPAVAGISIDEPLRQEAERRLAESEDRLDHDPILIWACLDRLADRLLQCEGRDEAAGRLVDRLVERLYGLNGDEIALVAGSC